MILHKKKDDFRNAVQATSESLGIRDIFIEKDYWITNILKKLHESEHVEDVVFKGGTSLSKAYDLVHRFSEDVDLVILGKDDLSNSQAKKKLRCIEKDIISAPLTVDDNFDSSKGSKFRKTGYKYPKLLDTNYSFGHATDVLILELNAFANPYPDQKMIIQSYIGKYFSKENKKFIEEYGLESFEIKVLGLERTFVEKILNLSRVSLKDNKGFDELKSAVRHFYDIHKLYNQQVIQDFIITSKYEETLKNAIQDDLSNADFREDWVSAFLHEVRLFVEIQDVFKAIENSYKYQFKGLLYFDEDVDLSDIENTFLRIKDGLPEIEIKVD